MAKVKHGKVMGTAQADSVTITDERVEVPVAKIDPIAEITGDPDAKRMGIAKAGGEWYKNYYTGKLYRIDKVDGKYKVMETKASAVPEKVAKAQAHNEAIKDKVAGKTPKTAVKAVGTAKDGSRAAMMARAKAKGILYFRILNKEELAAVIDMYDHAEKKGIKEPAKIDGITTIINNAKKRWQACPFFQKKAGK